MLIIYQNVQLTFKKAHQTLASVLINYTTKKGYVYVAKYDLINSFWFKIPPGAEFW